MHADDPVHWQDWSPQILKLAQASNKPILISSGYFACHWCHVMQQENYQHKPAAGLMNQHFISVKLDRELNPDLDRYLIEFSRQLTGRAGWPQHVVLTPQGYPFSAFGYLPNDQYQTTLNNIHQAWSKRPQQIKQLAKSASMQRQTTHSQVLSPNEFSRAFFAQLESQMDDLSGGLKGSSKFPLTPMLLALLKQPKLNDTQQDWLELTLEQMQDQHLQDHINGGFYRYTVDPEWQIPHFEKMGYDNALLAQAYFIAGDKMQRQDFIQTAQQTLSYMEQHLFTPALGLFASSQSALDQQGLEGGPYLLNRQQLQQKLSKPVFDYIKQSWQLDSPPPYELGWHPSVTEQHWPQIKQALQTPVKQIPKDKKHILSWNGLALSAYVSGYKVTRNPKYLQRAQQLASTLIALLKHNKAPRALTVDGQRIGLATLEDYAYIIHGLDALQQASATASLSKTIQALNSSAQQLFLSPQGWQESQQLRLPGQSRQAALMDDAIPSASALLECLTEDQGASRNPLFAAQLLQAPLSYASYLQVIPCPQP